ncbi:MAG TPA: 3-phosphoshikimate 1-carboxyvinyltransferase [Candidatus Eisenbacteria bacterium]|jgi:3-phosphoshikimate 1-carboxyvinyltransferase
MAAPVPDRLTVLPGPPLLGELDPPGDKSITHRAYLLGALATGETRVQNPNPGADCESTLTCLEALGATVERGRGVTTMGGLAGTFLEPDRVLDCGNSGTTLRLLSGPLAAHEFLSVLAGDASLCRRPVARVIEPLRQMGARLWARGGGRFPPLVVLGGALKPVHYRLPVASAQVASSVLLAGLYAPGSTAVDIPGPARDHTERLLSLMGVELTAEERPDGGRRVALEGPARPRGTPLTVAGDFSASAFFLAAAAAVPGASVTARRVGLNPTRTGLLDVLAAMGATVLTDRVRIEAGEPVGDVTVTGPDHLQAFDVPPEWLPRLVDEVPAWAIAASAARGVSRLTGAAELRVKETDRLEAIAENFGCLGLSARRLDGGLAIEGGRAAGGLAHSHGDHRIAMAFAVLGTLARQPVTVEDTSSISTSYPGFLEALERLGAVTRGEATLGAS